MNIRDPKGSEQYWYDGVSSTVLKFIDSVNIANQSYWYNGSPQGFLSISGTIPRPRTFAFLIGF